MLNLDAITVRLGGRVVLDGASAAIPAGHKVGIVGRNGAGKSTLLRIIQGALDPDHGTVRMPRRARIAAVAQEAPGGPDRLIDWVLAADSERADLLGRAEQAKDASAIAAIHERLAAIGAERAPARAARILAGLGFDEAAQQRPLDDFSGGWRMRVALAATLFLEPDLLLLDEPTNYLDLEGALWLEGHLRRYPHTILIVSHDREVLNGVADHILHVIAGRLELYRGGYDSFERTRRERLEREEKMRGKQEQQRKHLQSFVDRFRYKAKLAPQAQSRLKALAKLQPIVSVIEQQTPAFAFPQPRGLAPPLLTLDGVAVGYDDGPDVLGELDLRLDPDDRIALIGRNGNGKTTLARLLAGRLAPRRGAFIAAPRLEVGYFGQHQIEELRPRETATDHLGRLLPGLKPADLRARLGQFGLSGDKATIAADDLSGGERARLVLALITAQSPNLLILDEPTNHLDIDAREVLIHALTEFEGAVVLISHDRHLVDLVAERLWLVAEGTARRYDGAVGDYAASILKAAADPAAQAPEPRPPEPKKAPTDKRDRASIKAARQADAARRRHLAPLKKRISRLERAMEDLATKHRALDAELERPELYEGDRAALTDLMKRRAEIARDHADVEQQWLDSAGELEAAEAAAD